MDGFGLKNNFGSIIWGGGKNYNNTVVLIKHAVQFGVANGLCSKDAGANAGYGCSNNQDCLGFKLLMDSDYW